MAGRAINYIYIGMELAVIPLFQSEVTPYQARGAMVATYNTSLVIGMLVMSCICRGTSTIQGDAAWMIPVGLFYMIPSFVLVGSFWLPESPRWLVLKDRREDALKMLRELREGKFTEHEIEQEFLAIEAACSQSQASNKDLSFSTRWLSIWSSKHIKRSGIVFGTNFFLHGTGNAFASMYGPLFYASLGVNPFSMTVINLSVNLLSSIATLILVDKIGRRPLLIEGAFVQTCGLLIMGGLGSAPNQTDSTVRGIVATMMIFGAGYTAAWGQLSHTITAELPSAEVRDVTYASGSLLAIGTQATMTFCLPYLLNEPYAGLGPKVGFIFGSLAGLSVLFAFFCVPETSGHSLEEIDILFNNKIPIRQFKKTTLEVDAESVSGKPSDVAIEIRAVHQETVN